MYNLKDFKKTVNDNFNDNYFKVSEDNHIILLSNANKILEMPNELLKKAKEKNIILNENALNLIDNIRQEANEMIVLVKKFISLNEQYDTVVKDFKNDVNNKDDELSDEVFKEFLRKLLSLLQMKNGLTAGLNEKILDKNFNILSNISKVHDKYLK